MRGNELHLTLPTSGLASTFESGHYAEVLRDSLTEVVGGTWRIRARAANAASSSGRRPAARESPAPQPSGDAEGDLPSADDEDMPEAGSGGAHDPVALLTQGLGAKVIDERDAG